MAAGPGSGETYAFTKDAVLRAIANLSAHPIHEHFAGYLAILRALRANGGHPARAADINEFHDRYLRAEGHPDTAPYVRPFKSRGKGLEPFNANVAGSYAPSSLRSKGKLIDVIRVDGTHRSATYDLLDDHAGAALDRLLKNNKVPVVSLTAFLYRDYGFRLEARDIQRTVALFRDEFGLRPDTSSEAATFDLLFADDSLNYQDGDLEAVQAVA
ncbi:hypothetical protein [uncultured Methylobacterium sp.]|uniref:hypothetical protein n=1 Tax=uncultured Methylobacterium sp. TaxID=157278 RepID=UPI0035CB9091